MMCCPPEVLDLNCYFERLRSHQLFLFEVKVKCIQIFPEFLPKPPFSPDFRTRVKFMDLSCLDLGKEKLEEITKRPSYIDEDECMSEGTEMSMKRVENYAEETVEEDECEESERSATPPKNTKKGASILHEIVDAGHGKVTVIPRNLCKRDDCGFNVPTKICCWRRTKEVCFRLPNDSSNNEEMDGGGRIVSPGELSEDADEAESVFVSDKWDEDDDGDDDQDISYENLWEQNVKDPSRVSLRAGQEINASKSCLFIIQPIRLLHMLQRYPVVFHVYYLYNGKPCVLGRVEAALSDGFFEAVEQSNRYGCIPSAARMDNCFCVYSRWTNEPVGRMTTTLGLTCYGKDVWTQLKSPEGNPNPGGCLEPVKTSIFMACDNVRRLAKRDVQHKPAIVSGAELLRIPCDRESAASKPVKSCNHPVHTVMHIGKPVTEESLAVKQSDSMSDLSVHSMVATISVNLPQCPTLMPSPKTQDVVVTVINKASEFLAEYEDATCPSDSQMELVDLLQQPVAIPIKMTEWADVHGIVCTHSPGECRHYTLLYPGRGFLKDMETTYTVKKNWALC